MSEKKTKYGPTDEARKLPRATTLNRKHVGLGGEVIRNRPGKHSTTIPEATPEEYAQLKHLTRLVKPLDGSEGQAEEVSEETTAEQTTKDNVAGDKSDRGTTKSNTKGGKG